MVGFLSRRVVSRMYTRESSTLGCDHSSLAGWLVGDEEEGRAGESLRGREKAQGLPGAKKEYGPCLPSRSLCLFLAFYSKLGLVSARSGSFPAGA